MVATYQVARSDTFIDAAYHRLVAMAVCVSKRRLAGIRHGSKRTSSVNCRPSGPVNVEVGRNPTQRHSTITRRLNEAIAVRNPAGEKRWRPKVRTSGNPTAPSPFPTRSGRRPAPRSRRSSTDGWLARDTGFGAEAAIAKQLIVVGEGVVPMARRGHDQERRMLFRITVIHGELAAIPPRCDGECLVSV